MKKTLFIFISLFTSLLFAQTKINSDYASAYRQALISFEDKQYGTSLKYAQEAIRLKKENVLKEVNKLERSLATREVRAAGDEINKVKKALQDRDEFDIAQIIEYYVEKKGNDYFNNSIKKLIAYIKTQEEYPEAQKLIGDIYKLEGEYTLAESFYQKALEYSHLLLR